MMSEMSRRSWDLYLNIAFRYLLTQLGENLENQVSLLYARYDDERKYIVLMIDIGYLRLTSSPEW